MIILWSWMEACLCKGRRGPWWQQLFLPWTRMGGSWCMCSFREPKLCILLLLWKKKRTWHLSLNATSVDHPTNQLAPIRGLDHARFQHQLQCRLLNSFHFSFPLWVLRLLSCLILKGGTCAKLTSHRTIKTNLLIFDNFYFKELLVGEKEDLLKLLTDKAFVQLCFPSIGWLVCCW